VKLQPLVARYGSPIYVYDLAAIRASHALLRRALPSTSLLYYSLKANPHPALVAELGRLGCRAEISSSGELANALAGGSQPEYCLYTGPAKTSGEIEQALRQGVTHFSIDSPTDHERVAAAAAAIGRPVDLLLRVNPDEAVPGLGLTMCGGPSQFGADVDWIRRAPAAFGGTPWTRVIGFHIYMGTNIADPATLLRTFAIAIRLTAELAALLEIEPELIDLGGGFGHPFAARGAASDLSELRPALEAQLDAAWPEWRAGRPQVAFEAGRYLVAAAGTLVCTVQDVKESQGYPFVVLDSGIHHLGGMAGLRRVPRIGAQLVRLDQPADAALLSDARVVGPLCTPLDQWALGANLPSLRPGDLLAIPNVGAYGLTGSLIAFLGRDTPVEVIIDGDQVKEASQLIITRCAR
jgi:diaminopimelate decarboxylase